MSERAGDVIDRYKLLQELGEGGMGTVWLAEQAEPVRRRVALKVIKLGMDTREVVARFEAERQALALMDHANIAKVLDGGATASGRPYFVMELVKGVPITDYCAARRLDVRARLALFAHVCDAIQHAHHKGIIHRDIKPSNVLVTVDDDRAVPKVIDFGIAKATNAELTQKTLFTQHAQMIGTPEYMAPEQAEVTGLDIDTRADVYSLGALLYELLTGARPFDFGAVVAKGYGELLRTIREDEPARPSTRIAALRGELDWIVMTAMAKDRTQRYETAHGLAADVRRYLADQPVQAAPPSAFYRLRKFATRRRAPLVATAVAVVLAIVGAGIWQQAERSAARVVGDRSERAAVAIADAGVALGRAIAAPISRDTEWVEVRASMVRVRDLLATGEVRGEVVTRAAALEARFAAAGTERQLAEELENVLITCATHPDLESWQRMERQLRQLFRANGFDLDRDDPQQIARRIREHRLAWRFSDMLELWIGTLGQMAALGGPPATFAKMQPWADAMFAADPDPLRTGIRKLIYSGTATPRSAVDALADAADLGAARVRTLAWLASAYLRAGAPDASNRIMREALRRFPTDVMLNFDYGYALAAQQRHPEAARRYAVALAFRPDAAGIWRVLGDALVKTGELENAREAMAESARLEPDYAPSWIRLGEVLLQLERGAEAEAAAHEAIRRDEAAPGGPGLLGRALMLQQRHAEALPVLERCEELASQAGGRWPDVAARWLTQCRRRLDGK